MTPPTRWPWRTAANVAIPITSRVRPSRSQKATKPCQRWDCILPRRFMAPPVSMVWIRDASWCSWPMKVSLAQAAGVSISLASASKPTRLASWTSV